MKINSKHRVLSIILSVLMVLSIMPVAVFADDGTTSNYVTLELTMQLFLYMVIRPSMAEPLPRA